MLQAYLALCPVPVEPFRFSLGQAPSLQALRCAWMPPTPLFAPFFGTMSLSDFPPSFIADVLHLDSPRGPRPRGVANGGTSRVPCKVFRCVRGVCDLAGSGHVSRWRPARCGLPRRGTASAPRLRNFRGSIPSPHLPRSTLAMRPRDRPAMTWGQCGSLFLHCMRLSLVAPCRLVPALLPIFHFSLLLPPSRLKKIPSYVLYRGSIASGGWIRTSDLWVMGVPELIPATHWNRCNYRNPSQLLQSRREEHVTT